MASKTVTVNVTDRGSLVGSDNGSSVKYSVSVSVAAAGGSNPINLNSSDPYTAELSRNDALGVYSCSVTMLYFNLDSIPMPNGRWAQAELIMSMRANGQNASGTAVVLETGGFDTGTTPVDADWGDPQADQEYGRIAGLTSSYASKTLQLNSLGLSDAIAAKAAGVNFAVNIASRHTVDNIVLGADFDVDDVDIQGPSTPQLRITYDDFDGISLGCSF